MKAKKILTAGIVACALAIAGTASAGLRFSYTVSYFSDNTKTILVGEGFTNCKGVTTILWGIKTGFRSAPQPEDLCPGP
jgi:hypothetical protein